ncbi:MAG: DUF1641 domain-containing protein [Sulfolobaceae archaeon]|nr:DUF1641 domain-containing protein [Sulfolobaceae archaeon]
MSSQEELDFDLLISKLDNKKIEKLAEIIDKIPSLSETINKLELLQSSGTLDFLVNSLIALNSMKGMINDELLQELGEKASMIMELLEKLEELQNNGTVSKLLDKMPSLVKLVESVEPLVNSGSLDFLTSLAIALSSLKGMITDEMLKDLGEKVSSLLQMVNALSEATKSPHKVTVTGLLKSLNDPDVQKGLGIFITFLKILGSTSS